MSTLEDLRHAHHPNCFVSRTDSGPGLGVHFAADADGAVQAELAPPAWWEGFTGVVHGGIIASLLDGAMVNALFARGTVAMTAELTIRYWRPWPVAQPATATGRVVRCEPPLYYAEASIASGGRVVASAKGKFMRAAAATLPAAVAGP